MAVPKKTRRPKPKPDDAPSATELEALLAALPDVPLEKLRGIVRGISTDGLREKKDRIL